MGGVCTDSRTLQEVDCFAIVLLSVLWLAADYTVCQPVSGPVWLCVCLVAPMVLSSLLWAALVCIRIDTRSY